MILLGALGAGTKQVNLFEWLFNLSINNIINTLTKA